MSTILQYCIFFVLWSFTWTIRVALSFILQYLRLRPCDTPIFAKFWIWDITKLSDHWKAPLRNLRVCEWKWITLIIVTVSHGFFKEKYENSKEKAIFVKWKFFSLLFYLSRTPSQIFSWEFSENYLFFFPVVNYRQGKGVRTFN